MCLVVLLVQQLRRAVVGAASAVQLERLATAGGLGRLLGPRLREPAMRRDLGVEGLPRVDQRFELFAALLGDGHEDAAQPALVGGRGGARRQGGVWVPSRRRKVVRRVGRRLAAAAAGRAAQERRPPEHDGRGATARGCPPKALARARAPALTYSTVNCSLKSHCRL